MRRDGRGGENETGGGRNRGPGYGPQIAADGRDKAEIVVRQDELPKLLRVVSDGASRVFVLMPAAKKVGAFLNNLDAFSVGCCL